MLIKILVIAAGCLFLMLLWRQFRNSSRATVRRTELFESFSIDFDSAISEKLLKVANDEAQIIPQAFLNFKLLKFDDLIPAQQKNVVKMTCLFRKPHPLLLPLISCGSEANELFGLVKTDPEMSAKIITVVNSPLYCVTQPITNINHAVKFIGVHQVKNIALQLCVQNHTEFKDEQQNQAYKTLWSISQLASELGALMATCLGECNAGDVSTCCLLSYLGDHAVLTSEPAIAQLYLDGNSLYQRVELIQQQLGVNSALVGGVMAEQWQLPKVINKGIAQSLLPINNITANASMTQPQLKQLVLCYIACRLAEYIIAKELIDISEVGPLNSDCAGEGDFYYLRQNIEYVGLNNINKIIKDSQFRQQANKIIAQHH